MWAGCSTDVGLLKDLGVSCGHSATDISPVAGLYMTLPKELRLHVGRLFSKGA